MDAMEALKAAGANVLVGCTYEAQTRTIVEALERVDFSPRATIVSASLGLDAYNTRVNEGWWQGEYVAGPTPWHVSVPRTGHYSKLSSAQFAEMYRDRTGDNVGYQGAATFGAAAALASAIEAAGTLDTESVRQALQATHLDEFYANISFDDNCQISAPMLVVQMQPREQQAQCTPGLPLDCISAAKEQTEQVVWDNKKSNPSRHPFIYPVPSWAQRRCEALGPGRSVNNSLAAATSSDFIPLADRPSDARAACSGHGNCSAQGNCTCEHMYAGLRCQFKKDHMGFCAPPMSRFELNPTRLAPACSLAQPPSRPAAQPPCRCRVQVALSGARLAASAVSEPAITTGYAITSCVIGAALLCGAWVIMARQQPLLKAAQPRVLMVVILGILVSLSAPFFFSRDHHASFDYLHACKDHGGREGREGHKGRGFECTYAEEGHVHLWTLDVMCNAQLWAWCTGFLVSFGAIYYKLYRITSLVIRRGGSLTARGVLRQRLAKAAPIVLLLVQSLVLLVMTVVAPLRWRLEMKEFIFEEGNEQYVVEETTGGCAIDDATLAFIVPLLLLRSCFLLLGSVLCYQARNLHVKYAEVKYISFTLWSQLQILVIAVLLGVFLSDKPSALFFVKLCFTLFTEGGTLVFLFAPKVLMLVRGKGLERARRVLNRTAVAAALGEKRPSDSLDSTPCNSRPGSRRPSNHLSPSPGSRRHIFVGATAETDLRITEERATEEARASSNAPRCITPAGSSEGSLDESGAESDGGGGGVGGGGDDGSGTGSRVDSGARGVGSSEIILAGEIIFDL